MAAGTPARTGLIVLGVVALLAGGAATAGATSNHLGIEAETSDAEAGETTTVTITLSNNGDSPTPAIVDVTSMPDGWEIENHSDDSGAWNSEETKWLFQRVESGSSVEPTLTLSIPDDASGEHEIEIRGTDSEMNVTTTATVELASESGESGESGEGGDGGTTSGGGPGFGVAVGLVAILAVSLLAARRD